MGLNRMRPAGSLAGEKITNREVVVLGDPIHDIFLDGSIEDPAIFTTQVIASRSGGALNVFENVKVLMSHNKSHFLSPYEWHQGLDWWNPHWTYSLIRTPIHTRGFLLSTKEHSSFYKNEDLVRRLRLYHDSVVIFADYDKGTLTSFPKQDDPWLNANYPLCIVDSRYRSLDLRWLEPFDIKIWHCTGDEFDKDWALNFDWVLHTDGPNHVRVSHIHTFCSDTFIPVPQDTPIVDTIGAGDTFTAAVAASLSDKEITPENILEAGKFAITACQDVIQKRYTAVTDVRLS